MRACWTWPRSWYRRGDAGSHGRRQDRTGKPAEAGQGAQGRRSAAQPRVERGGRNAGRSDDFGLGCASIYDCLAGGLCRVSGAGRRGPLGAGESGRNRGCDALPGNACTGPIRAGWRFGGGRGNDRRGGADGRGADSSAADCLQGRPAESAEQCEERVFHAVRFKAGQVADSGRVSGRLCGSAGGAPVAYSALFADADDPGGRGRIQPADNGGLAAVWLGAGGLPGGVAEPGVAAEDEPPGDARGVQGVGGQPADSRADPEPAAAGATAPGEGRCVEGRRGDHQSDALRGGPGL